MEFYFFKKVFEDKEIMNPLNPEEVFTCSDLVKDFKRCRKEWRMKTQKKANMRSCYEYRSVAY